MTSTPLPTGVAPALADAARQALRAPSVFNSQPWRWRVGTDTLELFADRDRQPAVTDPNGRRWTNRPAWSGDGVPASTAVRQVPRRVPIRDYALAAEPGLDVGAGHDAGAAYTVLFGDADDAAQWLRAGEALSELLLTAVAEGLSAAPLSDTIDFSDEEVSVRCDRSS